MHKRKTLRLHSLLTGWTQKNTKALNAPACLRWGEVLRQIVPTDDAVDGTLAWTQPACSLRIHTVLQPHNLGLAYCFPRLARHLLTSTHSHKST